MHVLSSVSDLSMFSELDRKQREANIMLCGNFHSRRHVFLLTDAQLKPRHLSDFFRVAVESRGAGSVMSSACLVRLLRWLLRGVLGSFQKGKAISTVQETINAG